MKFQNAHLKCILFLKHSSDALMHFKNEAPWACVHITGVLVVRQCVIYWSGKSHYLRAAWCGCEITYGQRLACKASALRALGGRCVRQNVKLCSDVYTCDQVCLLTGTSCLFPLESPLEEDARWYTRVCVYQRVKEGETVFAYVQSKPHLSTYTRYVKFDQQPIKLINTSVILAVICISLF